jgi:hypothetical protein
MWLPPHRLPFLHQMHLWKVGNGVQMEHLVNDRWVVGALAVAVEKTLRMTVPGGSPGLAQPLVAG